MGRNDELEVVRLAAAEIDDQAIAEIARLLKPLSNREVTPSWLIRFAASGPLFVARRPCGARPEIVGVAGFACDDRQHFVEMIAVDVGFADQGLGETLRQQLSVTPRRPSVFRRRDRPPMGVSAFRSAG
ncbi:hypothetical protein [Phenylobacterium sp.]|uniref:hypothetical protein n=1 Tax=Phenylobacterium sp. TaxID=1871053 RepID=UPI00286AE270|nr:hypothetical protein [Phenylobacterium sp.]